MFDFSLAELGIAAVVALLVLGPKDMVAVMKAMKKATSKIKNYYDEYAGYLNDAVNEIEEDNVLSDTIIDLDGNVHRTYNLSKIMPDFKDEEVKEKKVAND